MVKNVFFVFFYFFLRRFEKCSGYNFIDFMMLLFELGSFKYIKLFFFLLLRGFNDI